MNSTLYRADIERSNEISKPWMGTLRRTAVEPLVISDGRHLFPLSSISPRPSAFFGPQQPTYDFLSLSLDVSCLHIGFRYFIQLGLRLRKRSALEALRH